MTISGDNLNYILFGVSLLLMLLDRAGYKLPILSGLIHQVATALGGVKVPAMPPIPMPPAPAHPLAPMPPPAPPAFAEIDLNDPEVQRLIEALLAKRK